MGSRKKKSEYLSYIEETPKQIGRIRDVASRATSEARKRALKRGNYVTYLEGKKIIREYPDGKKVTLKIVQESGIPVDRNGKLRLSKR